MNKFTFTCDNDGRVNTMEFEAEYWHEALECFKDFLRGAGYVFDSDLVDETFHDELYDYGLSDPAYEFDEDNFQETVAQEQPKQFDFANHSPTNWPFYNEHCSEQKCCESCRCK